MPSPLQVHVVDHATVLPLTDSSVEHWEPGVLSVLPHRSVNREYEPAWTVSNVPQTVVARR